MSEGTTHASERTRPPAPGAPGTVLGGYEILGELGRGGMGIVYKARDRKTLKTVALKTGVHAGPEWRQRFKQEFRRVADVRHPNLVALYDLDGDGEPWFFTMEFVEGATFLCYLRAQADREATLRALLVQLAEALSALHSRGIIHRDIKPTNVLVTPAGEVKLLDFGLAAGLDSDGRHESTHISGTWAYMSPEQAAGQPLTPASDWFSVGVLLYEALTGVAPLPGSAEGRSRLPYQEPPPPRALAADAPLDLDELCVALLRRDPEARPRLAEVSATLRASLAPVRAVPSLAPFVGRESHLAALAEAADADGTVVAWVRGQSGAGKSTLVQRFLAGLSTRQSLVLQGRCYQQEALPFKAVDGLIDELAEHWRGLSRDLALPLVPRDVEPLLRVFPMLGRVGALGEAPRRGEVIEPSVLRRRAFAALRDVIGKLGDRFRLVLHIDDLQWGDLDSVQLLLDLLRPGEPSVRMVLIVCARGREESGSPCLSALSAGLAGVGLTPRLIEVEPLPQAEAERLAEQLLGGDDTLAGRIARESGGNPYFIHELVQHSGSVSGDVSLDEAIWSRVGALPPEALRLLALLAAAGKPLGADDAAKAAGWPGLPADARQPLRAGRLAREIESGRGLLLACYHDRVRESVLNHLDAAARDDNHLRLADAFAAAGDPEQLFDIAIHFDAAGQSHRALPFARRAAELALAQGSREAAQQQYEIAWRGATDAPPAERFAIARALGDVLTQRGRYEEAAPRYREARAWAATDAERAGIDGRLGELAFKKGNIGEGTRLSEEALRLLRRNPPRTRVGVVVGLALGAGRQTLHTLLPQWFVGRRPAMQAGDDLLAAYLYTRLTYNFWFSRGWVATMEANLRGLNLAEAYAPTEALAALYTTHGVGMTLFGWYDRGLRYLDRALQMRRGWRDIAGQGRALSFSGIVLCAAGRYSEALAKCGESVRLLERAGDPWETNIARYHSAVALYRLGHLRAAEAAGRETFEKALRLEDTPMPHFCLDVRAKAAGGALAFPDLVGRLAVVPEDAQASSQVRQAEGVWHLRHGRTAEAAEAMRAAREVARTAGVWNLHTLPVWSWLATALRRHAEALAVRSPEEAAPVFREAESAAHYAERLSRRYPADRPHALRELGLLFSARGCHRRAFPLIQESVAVAERQSARYEAALSRLALGEVTVRIGKDGAAEAREEARHQVEAIEADTSDPR